MHQCSNIKYKTTNSWLAAPFAYKVIHFTSQLRAEQFVSREARRERDESVDVWVRTC